MEMVKNRGRGSGLNISKKSDKFILCGVSDNDAGEASLRLRFQPGGFRVLTLQPYDVCWLIPFDELEGIMES